MKNYKFDGTHDTDLYGNHIKMRSRLKKLHEAEKYLIKRCDELEISLSFDCAADERLNWNTLNYTNYCGMIYISTLCTDLNLYKLYDALIDNMEPIGHIDFIRNNIKNKVGNKYVMNTDSSDNEFESSDIQSKVICILPGHNKFPTICRTKIKTIAKHYKKDLLFKLHPICENDILEKIGFFDTVYGSGCKVADQLSNMYELIENAEYVYSTHASETPLTSLILGKRIEPIDNYDKRKNHGFSALNHFCYTYQYDNAVERLGKIFASHKSGIIHPDIDKDWKNKIDMYLEYILNQRESQNGFYVR